MSVVTAIARARRREKELARSTCTITRPSGAGTTFDPVTGTYADVAGPVVYTGWCMVRPEERQGSDVEAGETEVRLSDYVVKVEADAPVKVHDVVKVLTSPDAGLVDKRLRVTDVPADEWQISRRLIAEEVT